MTLSLAQSLESLALGQAMLVAPALGESYEGKTAGTVAALLLMLAQDLDALPGRRFAMRARLQKLLGEARIDDAVISAEVTEALAAGDASWEAQENRLLGALAAVHAWAETQDRALATRCLDWLVDWSEGERLRPPVLPG